MQSFQRFDRTTTLMVVLLVTSFLLATFDVRSEGGGIGATMRDGAQTLFAPLQDVASAVTRPVVSFIDALSDIASLRAENDALRLENEQLKSQLDQVDSMEAELEHLMEINGLEAPEGLPTVSARISSSASSSFEQTRYIDKGSDDGISRGAAVIDERGLVGRIDLVFAHRARVRLILDPNVEVAVRDQATSQEGIVSGNNDNPLVLRMFDVEEAARAGSVVVTAGSRFPPGIIVGTISETATDDAGFGLVTSVAPAVSFSRLDYVKVIVGYSPLNAPGAEEQQTEEEGTTDGQQEDGTTSDGSVDTSVPEEGSEG